MGKAAQKRRTKAIRKEFNKAKKESKNTIYSWYTLWLYPISDSERKVL